MTDHDDILGNSSRSCLTLYSRRKEEENEMRNETKGILNEIRYMRGSQNKDNYVYLLDDKKVLHVFEDY